MSFEHTISVTDRELGIDYAPVHTPPCPFFRIIEATFPTGKVASLTI